MWFGAEGSVVTVRTPGGDATSGDAQLDTARSDFVQDITDEVRLDLDRVILRGEAVVPADRPENRSFCRGSIESLEPETIGQKIRNRGLESVQTRERVLANPDQDVDAQARSTRHLCELLREAEQGPTPQT